MRSPLTVSLLLTVAACGGEVGGPGPTIGGGDSDSDVTGGDGPGDEVTAGDGDEGDIGDGADGSGGDEGEGSPVTITVGPTVHASPTQVTVTWETDVPATTELHVGPMSRASTADYPRHSTVPDVMSTRHSRTLSDLEADTIYYFRVRSSDGTGEPAAVSAEGTLSLAPGLRPTSAIVPSGHVQAVAVGGDVVYFGGTFDAVQTRTGPGVFVDAATALPPADQAQVEGEDGEVHVAIPDGEGGFYIGGEFTRVGGVEAPYAAHILPDGGVDPAWTPRPNDSVYAMARDGDTVYLGGAFTMIGTTPRTRAAAIDASGAVVAGFAPTFNVQPLVFVVDGTTLYVGGSFTSVSGVERKGLAAVALADGELSGFNPAVTGGSFLGATVQTIAIASSTLYFGGSFAAVGGVERVNAAAVDKTSGALLDWEPAPNEHVYAIAVFGSSVYLGGAFSNIGATPRAFFAAVHGETAALDPLDLQLNGAVRGLVVDGAQLALVGDFRSLGAVPRRYAATVVLASGAPTTWEPTTNGSVYTYARSGQRVFLGGYFSAASERAARGGIAAVDVNSGALLPFAPQLSTGSAVFLPGAFAIVPSGNTVYVGGRFNQVNGTTPRQNLAAFDATSGAVTAWNPGANGDVISLALDGSTLYVSGSFSTLGGAPRTNIGALDTGSNAATGWTSQVSFSTASQLYPRSNGLYVTGNISFTNGADTIRSPFILDKGTGALSAWNPAPNLPAGAVAFLSSRVVLGGSFSTVGGTPRSNLAAVDAGTAVLDGSWGPAPGNLPTQHNALGVFAGRLYLCGNFHRAGALSFTYAVEAETAAAVTFDALLDQDCQSLAYHSASGTVIYGGSFQTSLDVSQRGLLLVRVAD